MAKLEPFNVQLISPDKSRLAGLLPIQSMDIYDSEGNYHPQGLYSTEIFGRPGEKTRMNKHGYIDMRTEIMHPKLFSELCRTKNLYTGIFSGKTHAVWNAKEKDFEKSDILDGKTGYSFFMEHFHEINFRKNNSIKREQRLLLLQKYKTQSMYRYLIVLPAGLREIEVEDDGRTIEEPINDLYRKVMRVANTIAVRGQNINDPTLDTARWTLQQTFNEIYEYIQNLLEGKKGFILGKWGTRVVHGGTRNVITAIDPAPKVLGGPNEIDVNQTIVGLHQYMKATIPLTIYGLKSGPYGTLITQLPGNIDLYQKDTLQKISFTPNNKVKERWGTADGLEDLINGFEDTSLRHKYATIEGHYIGLIYDDGNFIKFVSDINEVPEEIDKKHIRGITWTELFYYSVYFQSKDVVGLVTRYPVTGPGSIYPSFIYLRVTNNGKKKEELGFDWKPSGKFWYELPVRDEEFFDSMSVHSNKADGLGADFDGDKTSLNILYSANSIKEGKKFLNSKDAYLSPTGGLNYGVGNGRNKIPLFVLHNFTSGLEDVA